MIEYHVFPGGKKRVVTFSFDDGHVADETLVQLFNKYHVKATFHINGQFKEGRKQDSLRERYQGHEISAHTVSHGWLTGMPFQSVMQEVLENRKTLEEIAGYPVVGMSYPSGLYNEDVKLAMRMSGIVYARTIKDTYDFALPQDFMEWHPTCHYKEAWRLCDTFLERLSERRKEPLFYIWGHSHELQSQKDWDDMDAFLKKISCNENIWYATNMEIYRYMTAQRALVISADESCFYNPTAIDVWVEKDKKKIIHVPAGQCIRYHERSND